MFEDLSNLMSISVVILKKIFNNLIYCICHSVLESYLNKSTYSSVDIGIGKLNIHINNDELEYKFIPSLKLENELVKTLQSKTSPLVSQCETVLTNKVNLTYKDLL